MLQFSDPQYFWLLAAIPVLTAAYIWSIIRTRRQMARLGDSRMVRALMPRRSAPRQHVRFSLLLLAIALTALVLARPQYGLKQGQETTEGIEVVVMMDVSNSMMARDVTPSRLDRAKLLVSNLVDRMNNDKLALGVFAGEAYPQLPITSDYAAAKLFLDALSPDMVTLQGTNIGAAIHLAEQSFTDTKNVGKAIVLITDGENHEAGAEEAVKEAAKKGINIFVIGVGTAQGAEIPTAGGPLTDAQGNVVHSALNEQMCRDIARTGRGIYLHLDQTNSAQDELLNQMSRLKHARSTSAFTERDEQFQAVALMALLALITATIVRETKTHRLQRFNIFNKKK